MGESAGEEIPHSVDNKAAPQTFALLSSSPQADKTIIPGESKKKSSIKGDIFGRKRRFFHPFISVREIYSDNIFNDDDAKESDFATLISPGFWASYPSLRRRNIQVRTSTMVPGGTTYYKINPLRRINYRTYFLYGYDHEIFASNSSENTGSHKAEASWQYRLGKSSLAVVDKYASSHDKRGEDGTGELNEYSSNLLSISYDYVKSVKFRYNLVYSLFAADYSNKGSEFRSRDDWALSGALYYRILPKTSLFGEYRYININYSGDERLSGKENHFFIGLDWKISSKSSGTLKAGYGLKQFDRFSSEDHRDIFLLLDMTHRLSSRNTIAFSLSRRTSETNQQGSLFIVSDDLSLSLKRRYSPKTIFSFALDLSRDKYEGDLPASGTGQEESNNTLGASLGVDHRINQVFSSGAGYSYRSKKAEPTLFDYTTNEVYIFLSANL